MKNLIYALLRVIGRVWAALLGGLKVEGRENVPQTGPALLVPNHFSDIDPPLVWLALRRHCRFMAKSELFEMRLLGPFIRFMGAFPVRRNTADRTALRTAGEFLEAGEAVVLFPEGKLSETGELQPFLPGAALIALRTGAPVIPVGLLNTSEMLPYGAQIPRRSSRPVRVKFGPPVPLNDLKSLPRSEAVEEAVRRMEAAVAGLIGQPVLAHQDREPESEDDSDDTESAPNAKKHEGNALPAG